jgi:glycosyltransferase involved in cell wall biosynthesis
MPDTTVPPVTIGIPTYNRADGYFRLALESAVRQTYKNIEIVVSDNCSTDNTEAVVKEIADARVRYFKQEKSLSPNENFNFCLNQAGGAYFLLLHDDDLIDEDFIAACMRKADFRLNWGVIRTGTRLIDAEGKVTSEVPNRSKGEGVEDLFLDWFNAKTAFYFCSTLFNTDLLKQVGGFHSRHNLVQDCAAILELGSRAGRLDVRETKASFRIHANYLRYGSMVKAWAEDFLWLLERICDTATGSTSVLRHEGERFFAGLSYKRATVVKSPLSRMAAYLTVFRLFGYRYFPPPVLRALHRSRSAFRIISENIKGITTS